MFRCAATFSRLDCLASSSAAAARCRAASRAASDAIALLRAYSSFSRSACCALISRSLCWRIRSSIGLGSICIIRSCARAQSVTSGTGTAADSRLNRSCNASISGGISTRLRNSSRVRVALSIASIILPGVGSCIGHLVLFSALCRPRLGFPDFHPLRKHSKGGNKHWQLSARTEGQGGPQIPGGLGCGPDRLLHHPRIHASDRSSPWHLAHRRLAACPAGRVAASRG